MEADDDDLIVDEMETPLERVQRIPTTVPLAVPLYKPLPNEPGFHRTARVCLDLIRDKMLRHQWQEAAEYIGCFTQTLFNRTAVKISEVAELIWRLGLEVLHHLPDSELADYITVYDRIKHLKVSLYPTVCLEQAFHLLLHGHVDEAHRRLTAAESWRYGKISAGLWQKTLLVQAYRGLVDYVLWCDKKPASSDAQFDDVGKEHRSHSCFRHASVTFKEILKCPGVWDPFVLCYVEMLQFYKDHEGAAEVLRNYARDGLQNPNSLVYLYQFLMKQRAADQSQVKDVLKELHALVPSHELMLEYSSLLLESEEADDLTLALAVVLDMLDFACWSRELRVWTRLHAVIDELRQRPDWKTVVAGKMADRLDWWPGFHFTRFHAAKDAEVSQDLLELKVGLLPVLFPDQTLEYCGSNAEA